MFITPKTQLQGWQNSSDCIKAIFLAKRYFGYTQMHEHQEHGGMGFITMVCKIQQ